MREITLTGIFKPVGDPFAGGVDASYVRAQDKNATVCQVTRPLEGVENEWQKFDMQAERQKGVTMTSRIKFFEHDGYVYSKKKQRGKRSLTP